MVMVLGGLFFFIVVGGIVGLSIWAAWALVHIHMESFHVFFAGGGWGKCRAGGILTGPCGCGPMSHSLVFLRFCSPQVLWGQGVFYGVVVTGIICEFIKSKALWRESSTCSVPPCSSMKTDAATGENCPCSSFSCSEGINLLCCPVSGLVGIAPSLVLGLAVPGGHVDTSMSSCGFDI